MRWRGRFAQRNARRLLTHAECFGLRCDQCEGMKRPVAFKGKWERASRSLYFGVVVSATGLMSGSKKRPPRVSRGEEQGKGLNPGREAGFSVAGGRTLGYSSPFRPGLRPAQSPRPAHRRKLLWRSGRRVRSGRHWLWFRRLLVLTFALSFLLSAAGVVSFVLILLFRPSRRRSL